MMKMGEKYIFTNILGSFAFDDSFKFIEKGSEKEMVKKYKGIKEPEENDIAKLLGFFKQHKFFSEFHNKNIKITRKSIKESVKKDLLIIHTIKNIEGIDKVTNILVKDLREWYEIYNPEFSKWIHDNKMFSEIIVKKSKNELLKGIKVKEGDSMGADLRSEDLNAIKGLAKMVNEMYCFGNKQQEYLRKLMLEECRNISEVAGALIGAKLIEFAGSLKRLSGFPASTIQLLGAEKALFRHMKTGARCPRHGIIVEHSLIKCSSQKEHGKRARALADKIALAARVDYFKGKFIGDKLKKELNAKFKATK